MARADKEVCSDEVSDQYGYRKNWRTALPQCIAVFVKNLLILGYGMTLGFNTILIPAVKEPKDGEPLHLDPSEISWISSINYIVVPIGCAVSGLVTTPIGRRRSMQVVNLPFFAAWLLFHFAPSTSCLYGALVLTGLAGGLLEAPVLTYVAEVTQPHLRGALSATSSMSIILGVFMQFLLGIFFYWRTVALINIIFTVLAVVALCFIPESPHWLMSRQRYDDARKSLQWLRGWCGPEAVESELKSIQLLFSQNTGGAEINTETLSEKLSHYYKRSFLIPCFLVSYAFFVGHFSGMTTLQTYSVSIFQMLEAPIDRYYATLILGILQLVGCGTCVILVHYTGKRPLTFFSTGGGAICCLMVAIYDYYIKTHAPVAINSTTETSFNSTNLESDNLNTANHYSWIPTIFMMLLALITHTGIRLLPWILIGEVFSTKTRSTAAGLSSAIGYIFGFLANKMYIRMVDMISIWGTYGFYGLVCLTGCIIFYFILPETEGKTLHDIENHFAGVKKISNNVYRQQKNVLEISKLQHLKGTTNPTFEDDNTKV